MVDYQDFNQRSRSAMAFGNERDRGWAQGLRQLYAGVVEEAVPADLDVLLGRLEGSSTQRAGNKNAGVRN
jgi:hypothetical protein